MGHNPWSMNWMNFTSTFLSQFAPLDLPSPALVFELETTTQYEILNGTIAEWRKSKGESMIDYANKFERDIMQQCPYPMDEEFKCLLFWRGVPVPIWHYTNLR